MVELAGGPGQEPKPQGEWRLTGRMVLFSLIAFFTVVSAVNATMIYMALQTMPGVDVKSAYEASQNFNREIARANAQTERGWQVDGDFADATKRGRLTLRFRDKAGEPLRGLQVEILIGHPADRKADRRVMLEEIAPGQYAAPFEAAHGVRDIEIQAKAGGQGVFRARERIKI